LNVLAKPIDVLEEKYRVAEEARKALEQKRIAYLEGKPVPGSTKEALMKLQDVRKTLSNMLEAEAFQRVSGVLDLAKTNVQTKEELKAFNTNVDELNNTFDLIMSTLRDMDRNLTILSNRLTDELSKQDVQRELEKETLQKLNTYLKTWLR